MARNHVCFFTQPLPILTHGDTLSWLFSNLPFSSVSPLQCYYQASYLAEKMGVMLTKFGLTHMLAIVSFSFPGTPRLKEANSVKDQLSSPCSLLEPGHQFSKHRSTCLLNRSPPPWTHSIIPVSKQARSGFASIML